MKATLFLIGLITLFSCGKDSDYRYYEGQAQGTTFHIKYHSFELEFEDEIDSILHYADLLFSTYIDDSYISRFNNSENGVDIDPVFADLWEKCWEVNIESDGRFDPTLTPVFLAYREMKENYLDSSLILNALQFTGMPMVRQKGDSLFKEDHRVKLGMDAIAQGYSVDMIAEFLQGKGIQDFMVEIGGEVYAHGRNPAKKNWVIGIDKPKDGNRELMASIELKNQSMATSGNYRKFKEIDGKKMGHIIDPKTGFPAYSNVLSVSVVADKCYRADALATALMTQSAEQIKDFDRSNDEISLVLIELQEGDTVLYCSRTLEGRIKKF